MKKMSKEHTHSLTPGLINTLLKFGYAAKRKGNMVHIRKDMDLNISENNNFQKLRYWGLVAKYEERGERKVGYWVLTRKGVFFLRGEIEIPKKITTKDNRIVGESDHKVTIKDCVPNQTEEYWQQHFQSEEQPKLF